MCTIVAEYHCCSDKGQVASLQSQDWTKATVAHAMNNRLKLANRAAAKAAGRRLPLHEAHDEAIRNRLGLLA